MEPSKAPLADQGAESGRGSGVLSSSPRWAWPDCDERRTFGAHARGGGGRVPESQSRHSSRTDRTTARREGWLEGIGSASCLLSRAVYPFRVPVDSGCRCHSGLAPCMSPASDRVAGEAHAGSRLAGRVPALIEELEQWEENVFTRIDRIERQGGILQDRLYSRLWSPAFFSSTSAATPAVSRRSCSARDVSPTRRLTGLPRRP
jgi:hypothetical protein